MSATPDAAQFVNMTVEATTVAQVAANDLVVLDPVYGRERVLASTPYVLHNGVTVRHMELETLFHLPEVHTAYRFVVRADHEPCLRMRAA